MATSATQRTASPVADSAADQLRCLRAELRRLEQVIASMADGFVLIDRAGRVVRMNAAAREIYRAILGVDDVDRLLARRPLDELFERRDRHGRPIARPDLPLWRALARGQTVPGQELRITVEGAPERTIVGSAAPIRDECGGVIGAVSVIQDITARRDAERVRDELLSMISHELRTPLTNVKAAIASLRRPEVAWDEAVRQDFLAIADEESDKLAELIEQLLDASALRAGAIQVQPEPVLVQRLAADLARAVGLRFPGALRTRFPRTFPPVLADPRRLGQVLHNLIDNALKYSAPGATVTVGGRVLSSTRAAITIADRGIGIPPSERQRVFEPFYRSERARGRGTGGSGLGLPFCRAIVEAHGGRIEVRPRRGGGSIFRLTLAIAPAGPSEE